MRTKNDELNIRFEEREGYFYAFFSGKRDALADAKRYWQKAIDECNKRGYKKLLVEQNFAVPLSAIDTYYLAEAIAHMAIRQLKIAFVDQDVEQNGMNMFAETVAVNRGGVGRVFINLEDAIAYLLEEPST
jgi:hypothetical protein